MGELFSLSTLIILLVIVVAIYGLFTYFNSKITEQQHAIKGMFGIVKTLAEDIQYIKRNMYEEDGEKLEYATQLLPSDNELISVSDGGNPIDDDDNEEDNDDTSYEELSDEEEEDEEEDILSKLNDTRIIHLEEPIIDCSVTNFEPMDLNFTSINDNDNDINNNIINSEHNNFIKQEENEPHLEEDLIDPEKFMNNSKQDYKKMSLNKLREIVVEKGLTVDASKLKKNELLHLLG